MKRPLNNLIYLSILLVFASCSSEQNMEIADVRIGRFSELLTAVSDADSAAQFSIVDEFMDSLSLPVVEDDSVVYFIYQGEVNSVAVAGDFSGWSPSGRSFIKLRNTNVWYRKELFESNARLDYKLVLNGSNWILDPGNPNRIAGGFGPNSELAMPAYEQPSEILEREEVPKGKVETINVPSKFTGRTYKVQVYLPFDYSQDNSYPVAYFQDGGEYLTLGSANTVMDNLIYDGLMRSSIGVFVTPNDRGIEYAFDDRFKYRDFFIEELVPTIDSMYSTLVDPSKRAVIGDSYGGNISAIIAFTRPDVFGNCGIHSGAFQPNSFETNDLVMDGIKREIRVASIWGTYEGSSLPPNMRRIRDYLQSEEYPLYWKEMPEGHSWGLWRATIDDFLIFFFPTN